MSEIRATTISDLAGTGPATLTGQYAAKAWVNFDGTGALFIRASGNVSSITDNSTGRYSVNFSTAMPDSNYSAVASAYNRMVGTNAGGFAVGAVDIDVLDNVSNFTDVSYISVTVTR